jgi:hypothetical protein
MLLVSNTSQQFIKPTKFQYNFSNRELRTHTTRSRRHNLTNNTMTLYHSHFFLMLHFGFTGIEIHTSVKCSCSTLCLPFCLFFSSGQKLDFWIFRLHFSIMPGNNQSSNASKCFHDSGSPLFKATRGI